MTERAWRQLLAETQPPRDRDGVLRMALAAMAADPASPLTKAQRQWIINLSSRTTPFTAQERAKLRTPLLRWLRERMPRCVALVEKQFDAGASS